MIRPLRSRHRWMTALMGVTALGGLGIGVMNRAPAAEMARLPPVLLPPPPSAPGRPLQAGADLWQGARLSTSIYPARVTLNVAIPLYRPDPLLYWVPQTSPVGQPLPKNAILLGPVAAGPGQQSFRLPQPTGALLLYSLAHGEVFASLNLAPETHGERHLQSD